MPESAQQFKNTDSDYYVISHQWFRVVYIIWCNSHKIPPGKPITDYQQQEKKKEKKIKSFCKHLLRILVEFP